MIVDTVEFIIALFGGGLVAGIAEIIRARSERRKIIDERKKVIAEAEKIKAEAEKVKAEAEKTKVEAKKIQAEAEKEISEIEQMAKKADVDKAFSLINELQEDNTRLRETLREQDAHIQKVADYYRAKCEEYELIIQGLRTEIAELRAIIDANGIDPVKKTRKGRYL